ncbi:MAG TPA: L,D-transpeptidase family protein [Anaerovoracaceae bacterium]|nr:L,D-transpeptidase family protein [Anaerovoracaceae bacterium]
MTTRNKFIGKYLPAALILSFIAAVFIFFTIFFNTHFYPGTVINEVDVSFLATEKADSKLSNWAAVYVLILNERGNVKEQIYGHEIGLRLDQAHSSPLLKKKQNETFWLPALFNRDGLIVRNAFTYNEDLLMKRFQALACLDPSKVAEPRNATLVYSNGAYTVVNEVYGNKVNDARLYSAIKTSVISGRPELDLEKRKCYIDPTIRSDSSKLTNTKAAVNKFLTSKITYIQGSGGSVTVDTDDIGQWIKFDDNLNVIFDTEIIKTFLKALAVKYDTRGTVRSFVTSSGRTISVGGGDYGWKVDIKKETENLIYDIMSGGTILKEPSYSQKGVLPGLNDIGSTYVEIDLTNQSLWLYVAGERIAGGPVVTGDMDGGYRTPEGIYSLKYKAKNAVLKGPNYRAQVSYWMPFNGDIGIHDASWRTDFGRDIYLARGSHGCINVQFYLAQKLYNNISVGTPIICYY